MGHVATAKLIVPDLIIRRAGDGSIPIIGECAGCGWEGMQSVSVQYGEQGEALTACSKCSEDLLEMAKETEEKRFTP